jgi:hypothetical protein
MPNVLDLIGSLPGKSAIVVRHAERFDIVGPDAYWTTGLTGRGMAQASEFGRTLAAHANSYRVYYSPVKRCQQTAEAIASSLAGSGKSVAPVQPEKLLGVSYIQVDIPRGFEEADRHGDDFIRAWFSGLVAPEIFKPLADARNDHIEYLQAKLGECNAPRHLDIHITHDWNINVLREGIFGLRHEDAGWPGFLSGIAFSEEEGRIRAYVRDNGRTISAAIPL